MGLFGFGGSMRRGAPRADDVVYDTHAQYRQGKNLHWVRSRGGGEILRECARVHGRVCAICDGDDERRLLACWRCHDRNRPCRECVARDRRERVRERDEREYEFHRLSALRGWLAEPDRLLPLEPTSAWRHRIPGWDTMWRYDVNDGEHVYDGIGVSNRRVRGEPCPVDRLCAQCHWGMRVLNLHREAADNANGKPYRPR